MDLGANQARFLDGLAAAALVDRELLDRPGTTVIGREDRAGSGALACYRAGPHLVVWCDPAVVDRAEALAGSETRGEDEVAAVLDRAGVGLHASLINRMLAGPAPPPPPVPEGYTQVWLDWPGPSTLEVVRAFTERCDVDDVEAAGLDELDEFDEAAINVLVPGPVGESADPADLVAYASASAWEWDAAMADIGVLIDVGHRRRGLANLVVASTVDRLLADGRVPFYRHLVTNRGSAAVAAGLGFAPVARLDYFTRSDES